MTKMGIKDFRERLAQVAQGDEVVELTHHGRVVGTYVPKPKFDRDAARRAAESIARWQADLRAKGVEPHDWLNELGLTPDGEPLEGAGDR